MVITILDWWEKQCQRFSEKKFPIPILTWFTVSLALYTFFRGVIWILTYYSWSWRWTSKTVKHRIFVVVIIAIFYLIYWIAYLFRFTFARNRVKSKFILTWNTSIFSTIISVVSAKFNLICRIHSFTSSTGCLLEPNIAQSTIWLVAIIIRLLA